MAKKNKKTEENLPKESNLREALSLVVTIVPKQNLTYFLKFFENHEVTFQTSFLAEGTASSDLLSYLGINPTNKTLITSIIKNSKLVEIEETLLIELKSHGKGISFVIPLSKFIGLTAYQFVTKNISRKEALKDAKNNMNDFLYEAIICIVNTGYSDEVMKLAKENNARGGTILAGRGTGNKEAEDFFGIVIQPEKEVIVIVAKKEQSDAIISAIYNGIGLNTKGHGIVFTLPVSKVMGLVDEEIK